MDRITEFLDGERAVYDKFRAAAPCVRQAGFLPDPVFDQRTGGIGVVVRHPKEFTEPLTAATQRMQRLGPCFGYDSITTHSTLCVLDVPKFEFDSRQHLGLLRILSDCVECVVGSLSTMRIKECSVRYDSPLCNQTTVVVPGEPTHAYVDLLLQIFDRCYAQLPAIRSSWGSHVTAARFFAALPPPRSTAFLTFLEKVHPFGTIPPSTLEVMWAETEETTLRLTPFRTFPFI